jgi:hypothetical protein
MQRSPKHPALVKAAVEATPLCGDHYAVRTVSPQLPHGTALLVCMLRLATMAGRLDRPLCTDGGRRI